MSWNASSIEQAENLALQYCGFGSCKIVTDFQKTCAALAASSNYGYGWGKGSNLSTVKIEALDQCRKYPSNENCTIVISQCDK